MIQHVHHQSLQMDMVNHTANEDSMEGVENYHGDIADIQFPLSSTYGNNNETWELNYSNLAQPSFGIRMVAEIIRAKTGVSHCSSPRWE